MKKTRITVGYKVDYHSIVGGPVTSTGHTIRAVERRPNNYGRDVAWVTGKAGCVALDALTPSPANNKKALKDCHGLEMKRRMRCTGRVCPKQPSNSFPIARNAMICTRCDKSGKDKQAWKE